MNISRRAVTEAMMWPCVVVQVEVVAQLNLAVFDIGATDAIIATRDGVTTWVIGGHSLGGAMATNYVYNHLGQVDGLVL